MNVLVLAPHTDDAEIGCGGSLMRWRSENLWVLCFSNCDKSLPKEFPEGSSVQEFKENMQKRDIRYETFDFPVRRFFKHRDKILDVLVDAKKTFKPDLVVCPSLNDIHQDHKVIAEEAVRAFREGSIISYNLPYSTMGFNPNFYMRLSLSDALEKVDMLKNYKSQKEKFPEYFSSNVVLAYLTTEGIKIKSQFAESFEVIRWIK